MREHAAKNLERETGGKLPDRDGAIGRGHFYEDREILAEACVTASRLNHALPDCIYVDLACRLNYTLLTGDRLFGNKGVALYPDIITVQISGRSRDDTNYISAGTQAERSEP